MKLARGFKGRYFSLVAIAATVGCIDLQATESRVAAHEHQIVQTAGEENEEETATLEDIIVDSALPSASSLKTVTSDVTVITSEELQSRHYRDILDALRHHSDFFVTQNGGPGQSAGFFLNGISSEHVLVMVDGVRLNDPTSTKGQAQLEHIRLEDVERIEVIKGAQSGVWGADASGGVVNIVTKGVKKGLHADARLGGGRYSTVDGALRLTYGDERVDLYAGADVYKTDGFPPKTTSKFDAGTFDRTYYAGAAFRPLEGTSVKAGYRQVLSHFDFEGFNDTTFKPEKQRGTSNLKLYNARVDQAFDALTVTLYGWGSDFERTYHGKGYDGKEYEGGLKGRYESDMGRFDLGVSHRKSEMDESYGKALDQDIRDNAIFGAYTVTMLDESLVLNAALRFDDYDAFEDKTTGKIGLKYRFDPVVLAANVGQGYRAPSLYERFGGDGYTLANPDLKPETTTTYDISLTAYGAKAGYFYNEIEDMIDYVFGANYAPGHYTNLDGTSKIQGFSLSYGRVVDVIDSSFRLGYQYVDAKDENDERLLRRPRHRLTASWDYLPTENLSLNLNAQYADDFLDRHYEGFQSEVVKMDSYVVVNAVANYSTPYGDIYLKVNNLLDEDYQLVDGYNTEGCAVYGGIKVHY